MDSFLARSLVDRPETKIKMRSPSWPNTPLHQYFDARITKIRNTDFVLSSLGYIRLYQYCSPCQKRHEPQPDSGSDFGSSFIHLEERRRFDEPFVIYRKSPQGNFNLGLTERDRERRLLKHYKYFQGFQRKLQVSRQFQQNQQKAGNKAKVKKIINYYKPEVEESSTKETTNPITDYKLDSNQQLIGPSPAVRKVAGSTEKHLHPATSTPKKENEARKGDKFRYPTPAETSELAELDSLAAVLANYPNTTNKVPCRKERYKVAPTLSTIEENFEPRPSVDQVIRQNRVQSTKSKSVGGNSALNSTQRDNPVTQEEPLISRVSRRQPIESTVSENEPMGDIIKKAQPCRTDNVTRPKESQSSRISAAQGKPRVRKRKPRKAFVRPASVSTYYNTQEIFANQIDSNGQIVVSKDATLKKVVKQKAIRDRPLFKRSGGSFADQPDFEPDNPDTDDRSEVTNDAEEEKQAEELKMENEEAGDQASLDEQIIGAEEDVQEKNIEADELVHGDTLGLAGEELANEGPTKEGTSQAIITAASSLEKDKPNLRHKVPFGNTANGKKKPKSSGIRRKFKFRGWDMGKPLETHALDHVPEETDLLEPLLQRAEKLQWEINMQTVATENQHLMPPKSGVDADDPKAYLQKHDIAQIFEHFTKALVTQRPEKPLDLLQGYTHDLVVQHEQHSGIKKDLKAMDEKAALRPSSSNIKWRLDQHFNKRFSKPKYKIHDPTGKKVPLKSRRDSEEKLVIHEDEKDVNQLPSTSSIETDI